MTYPVHFSVLGYTTTLSGVSLFEPRKARDRLKGLERLQPPQMERVETYEDWAQFWAKHALAFAPELSVPEVNLAEKNLYIVNTGRIWPGEQRLVSRVHLAGNDTLSIEHVTAHRPVDGSERPSRRQHTFFLTLNKAIEPREVRIVSTHLTDLIPPMTPEEQDLNECLEPLSKLEAMCKDITGQQPTYHEKAQVLFHAIKGPILQNTRELMDLMAPLRAQVLKAYELRREVARQRLEELIAIGQEGQDFSRDRSPIIGGSVS